MPYAKYFEVFNKVKKNKKNQYNYNQEKKLKYFISTIRINTINIFFEKKKDFFFIIYIKSHIIIIIKKVTILTNILIKSQKFKNCFANFYINN